jgi:hypothetical protein
MLDKFRLKFRELFSSCCCCCKSVIRMKSPSSAMIPFKASSTAQHPSPISTTNTNRYNINNKYKRNANSSSTINTGQTSGNNNTTRHAGINAYTHNGHVTFRLTNV